MSPLSRISLCSIALSACFMIGCSSTHWLEARAPAGPDLLMPGAHLLAAEDELPPDETVPLLRLPPEEQERIDRPKKEGGSRLRIGVRGGTFTSSDTTHPWNDSVTLGVYLRQSPRKKKGMVIEFAADYVEAETTDGVRSSTLYFARGDLLFGRFGPSGATMYFFLGGQAIIEESTDNQIDLTEEYVNGGATAGLGFGAASGLWDLKGTYTYLPDTVNATGLVAVSFGLAF